MATPIYIGKGYYTAYVGRHNERLVETKIMTTVLIVVVVVALVVLIVRGLWRATAVQKGTGCPCCDKAMGVGHEHAGAGDKQDGKSKPTCKA